MLKLTASCLVALLMSVALCAQQGSSEELKQKQSEIQREIDELKHTLTDSKKRTRAGVAELEMVKKRLKLREQAINNINHQISYLEGTIGKSKNEIDSLRNRLDTMKVQYGHNIVYAYKLRNNYQFLSFIFSAPTFNDAFKRAQYFRAYHSYCEQQAVAIKTTQKVLKGKIAGLELTRKEKDVVAQKQEQQKLELEAEKKEKDEVLKSLKSREKEIKQELTAKKKADSKLRGEIQKVIIREINMAKRLEDKDKGKPARETAANTARNNKNSKNTTAKKEPKKSVLENTPEGIRISGSFEKNKGKLPWPVEKAITKLHFGPNRLPGISIVAPNPGLTLETEKSAKVKVVFEGDVMAVFTVEDMWSVMVKHGKYFTVYGNLSSVSVSKNQRLTAGQVVGTAGTNDGGNGELEFILMQERKNIDPAKWLSRK